MALLIIEDDAAVSHLMTAVFRRFGIETVHVARGDLAIEQIDASGDGYEAVILDLMLPGVNGLEVLQHMAATRPHLLRRVLVITAASNDVLEKLRTGPQPRRVLRKPFELQALQDAVLDCMDRESFTPPKREAPDERGRTAPADHDS